MLVPGADNTLRPFCLKLRFPTGNLILDVATGGARLHAQNTLTTKYFDGDAPVFSPPGDLLRPARIVALLHARYLRRLTGAQEFEDGLPIDIILVV
jgi:hypothetical protein